MIKLTNISETDVACIKTIDGIVSIEPKDTLEIEANKVLNKVLPSILVKDAEALEELTEEEVEEVLEDDKELPGTTGEIDETKEETKEELVDGDTEGKDSVQEVVVGGVTLPVSEPTDLTEEEKEVLADDATEFESEEELDKAIEEGTVETTVIEQPKATVLDKLKGLLPGARTEEAKDAIQSQINVLEGNSEGTIN